MRDKKSYKRIGLAYLVLVTLIISPSVVGQWDLWTDSFDYTGGFATDTGSGWSGTFTATEGVVTVRQGIIIDVDWD